MAIEKAFAPESRDRDIVSSLFIAVLIGIAYKEMVPVVRDSVRSSGLTLVQLLLSPRSAAFGTLTLFVVFILNSLRFTIGNQLHLLRLAEVSGLAWLYDFVMVFNESVIFIFLGGLCSLEQNKQAGIGFVGTFALLLVLDVLWVGSQWVWGRKNVPKGWLFLNGGLLVVMGILAYCTLGPYSNGFLGSLFLLSVLAFVVDVILLDYYGLLVRKSSTEKLRDG